MKKIHFPSMKFHTIYSVVLSVLFLAIVLVVPDITLAATSIFVILYVVGNGIIHSRKNELNRDTLIEYMLVSAVALVILIGTVIK